MSFLYKTRLCTVVNAALAISGKSDPPATTLEELEDDEEMARNSIEYATLMANESLFIRFSRKAASRFHPRKPRNSDSDNDDRLSSSGRGTSTSENDLLRGFGASSASMSSFSSFSSSVFNNELADQMEEAGLDEIDVRIAQMQNQRERQGKRRMRAQKHNEKRSWNVGSKTAAFDDLLHVERESRMDIEDIEVEFFEPVADGWTQHPFTGMVAVFIEEQRDRLLITAEEQDDSAEKVVKAFHAVDDALEEMELESVCKREEAARAAYASASRASSRLMQQSAVRASPTPAMQFHVSPAGATAACESPSPSACSSDHEQRLLSGALRQQQMTFLGREPMPIPAFVKLKQEKKPPPPPPPPSDEEILLQMKVRKERYSREKTEREQEIERGVIVAHFKAEWEAAVHAPPRPTAKFAPGSLEERIAYAHRVDLRPPR